MKELTPRPEGDERDCTLLAVAGRMLDRIEKEGDGSDNERLDVVADISALFVLFDQAIELRRRLVQASLELEHAAGAGYDARQADLVTRPFLEGALRISMPLVTSGERIEGPSQ